MTNGRLTRAGCLVAVLGCCAGVAWAQPPASSEIRPDFSGIDAWMQCEQKRPAASEQDCYGASARTEGGRLAELSIPGFGEVPKERQDTAPASKVAALVAAMRGWDLQQLDGDAAALFPPQAGRLARIYVVGNGVPAWGDMYERSFADPAGQARPDDNGEPVILINARIVATIYAGDAAGQAARAADVLRHELFHVHYAVFRQKDERWRRVLPAMTDDQRLLLVVQDEGIAHFLAGQREWRKTGFPAGRGEKAMAALAGAIDSLRAGGSPEKILRSADEGPFWEKFGAISGALFAWGVEKNYGTGGLRRTLREGPPSLILLYDQATTRDSSLPPLPAPVRAWAERNAGMLPPVVQTPR